MGRLRAEVVLSGTKSSGTKWHHMERLRTAKWRLQHRAERWAWLLAEDAVKVGESRVAGRAEDARARATLAVQNQRSRQRSIHLAALVFGRSQPALAVDVWHLELVGAPASRRAGACTGRGHGLAICELGRDERRAAGERRDATTAQASGMMAAGGPRSAQETSGEGRRPGSPLRVGC